MPEGIYDHKNAHRWNNKLLDELSTASGVNKQTIKTSAKELAQAVNINLDKLTAQYFATSKPLNPVELQAINLAYEAEVALP
jgi:hypothetical protein